ncbi:hypothetical protein TEA_002644 [Camellia sinensis var. sinensis]|uniref:Methyltransferase n=1 Tax=Camellia sinensis var. sinensis TaxID=542762 RepID=A0A4S4DQJ2_CAMSN|nr:hypothetical protein TEA_002644 [Camellia sinensis var. sinensis]
MCWSNLPTFLSLDLYLGLKKKKVLVKPANLHNCPLVGQRFVRKRLWKRRGLEPHLSRVSLHGFRRWGSNSAMGGIKAAVPPPPPTLVATPPLHHHSMPMENPNRLSNDEWPPGAVPPPPPTPTAAPPLHHHSMPMENPNRLSNDEVNCKGEHPMGFALFTTPPFAIAAKDGLQEMVFDEESKSILHTEMAKKNLFVKWVSCKLGCILVQKNVIAMSFAPRDSHEAQVQFALERGVPAIIGVLGTIKLPYPPRAFDMAHCSRCLIPWGGNDGMYMMEVDRVLRTGGVNKEYCSERESRATICDSTNPDDAWYKKMEVCVTPYPATNGPDEVAGGELKPFPDRLNSVPPRIASGSVPGVTVDSFHDDNKLWKKHLNAYKRVNLA